MNADDLIAEFKELADFDAETRIYRTRVGDAETVQLVPSYKKNAVQRFKALAADAATLFDLPGPSDPVTRWLRFVLDHAPELVEDCKDTLGHSLGEALEPHDDGTERRVPFIAQTLPNAASASALVVRRCRRSNERAQADLTAEVREAAIADRIEPQEAGDGSMAVHDEARLSPAELAERFGVPKDALRQRLDEWRKKHHEGWYEVTDRKPREAQYIYRVGSVRHIIEQMQATSQLTSE